MRTLVVSLSVASVAWAATDYSALQPVFEAQCGACHSEKQKTSGFSIASMEAVIRGGSKHGQAVIAGHPENSPLVKMLKGELQPAMPMGKPLAPEAIAKVEAWVKSLTAEQAGLRKQEWRWPFERPKRVAPPDVQNDAWVRNPVDRFILSRLDKGGLRPAAEAAPRVLARRLYFDLLGVAPSPGEIDAFLSDDRPGAYERLVERLLVDPRYGERWGRHWLDLVRYGETSGLEGDGAIGNAWRYRDWVVQAFNNDMPYDRFVLQQLGGADEHSQTRNNYPINVQGHVPLGFLRVAPWDRSNLVAEDVRANYLAEVTAATSSIFLGMTMGCARCHDHKYDPIPQRDYYRFQAFFNAIQVENETVPYKDKAFAAKADAKIKEYEKLLRDGPEKVALDQYEKELLPKLIAARRAAAQGKELTREDLRLELRRETGVFTASERERHADIKEDADRTQDPDEKKILDEHEAGLLVLLKERYARPGVDAAKRFDALTVADVRAEASRQSSKIFSEAERDKHTELTQKLDVYQRRLGRWRPVALTVKNVAGPPNGPMLAPMRILLRGDYRQPGGEVTPGFPTVITGKEETAEMITDRYRQYPTRGWRLTLARWIASPENPLTARVMVNRIWQHHFGRGIVATPSDFGKNGERPSHPELLDWLALEFMDRGWSVKEMHRLMVNSSTYRQSPENPAMAANAADPDNKLLWRFARRRLEAEVIRDSILAASGRLNPEMGGPSMFPPLPEDLADFARYGRGGGLMWETNEREADARRRSLYIFQRRSLPLPMMAAFDATVFSESCDRRSVTTTPLQALSMMNGYLVHEEAAELARRVTREAGANREAQVKRAFEIVLNRAPRADELTQFAQHGAPLEAICRVLFNSNEFIYLE
ncbi:MAG: PSD1 domain-containing protein [Bryobacterales bacterium]|nr:PSD1 domain-containing protein [Bryobacterales bacterium]